MGPSDCVMIPAICRDPTQFTVFFDSRLAAMTLYKVYNLGFFVPNVTTMYIIICIMYYTVSDPYYSYA